MRHLLIFILALSLFAVPALAQSDDAAIYVVTDVAADVTADSAAHARDQAVAQAQRTAFNQLLDRLGAPASVAQKLSDDDIAAMVKSFEVQSERASSVRYLGTFTVQFKPNTVRNYLASHNASFKETRSDPILVLPIYVNGNQSVLWEDKTKWRAAWEANASNAGLVPIIVPAGGLDDIAVISSAEAVQGKNSSIKAIIDKYQAHGAVVAVLTGDTDKPGNAFKIDITHYDMDGDAGDATQLTVPAATTKTGIDGALTQAVQQVRHQLEKDWQHEAQNEVAEANDDQKPITIGNNLPTAQQEPTTHLPVTVAINSLQEWAQIEHKLSNIPAIVRVGVITLQRGSTSIEIEFRGGVDGLQVALNQQGLVLKQDGFTKLWTLRPLQIGGN